MKVSECHIANPAGSDTGPEMNAVVDPICGHPWGKATVVSAGEEVWALLQLQEKRGRAVIRVNQHKWVQMWQDSNPAAGLSTFITKRPAVLRVSVCVCAQSCPALGEPMDCSPSGSSIHGIFEARILHWATSSSRGSSQPRNWTRVLWSSALAGGFLTTSTTWEAPAILL